MADVITRFKLETTQFDSKLRDTSKALRDIAHQAELGGKDFDKFSNEAIKSAKALGTVQSGATNTKDKLRDLVGSYNDAAKAYNSLTDTAKKGEFGRAMSQSLTQLQQRIKETKQEIYGLGDSMKNTGGLFGGGKIDGMLQVFGGNLMTKGAGMLAGLASEMGDMVKQGIELAQQGEGIRIAFQRLGRGDILDGLREATHGTVTDLELMKAAVKFNDFKLPLEELGTMLAFAQQKAKDTGQSVDYMVDSIVTGLGRKSLMILDNLGLSATEIRDKMKETGDMTKAVGAIIREQMQKAGDYVETAADRATQANVALQNKMEELGNKFLPVKQASDDLWTSIKIGILDIVGGPLADLLNGLTRAGQLRNQLKNIGSDERVNTDIAKLKGSNFKQQVYTAMLNKYSREEQKALDNFKKAQKGGMGSIAIWENRYLAQKAMREDFQARGNAIVNPTPVTTTPVPVEIKNPVGGTSNNTPDLSKIYFDPNKAALGAIKNEDGGLSEAFSAYKESMKEQTDTTNELIKAFENLNKAEGVKPGEKQEKEVKGEYKSFSDEMNKITQGVSGIVSGIEQLGIELPQGLKSVLGGIQAIAGILTGISALVTIITAIQGTKSIPIIGWALAHGGTVPHAANGYYVPGTHASGDVTPIMANAGELVLNKSSQGNLANDLKGAEALVQTIDRYQESIMRGSQMGNAASYMPSNNAAAGGSPYITGEIIYMGLSAYLESSGRGEIVTSRKRG